ncbi:MAG: GNAT family N-acetyltransferase [Oscillospiraceae bacterium]|nr:GNAT family N-acetyltransferase [Oscillospiraceae bacterium]MBQ9838500.1 GNAT family N-acetyltransferase [Oscillospiraceae bacterium]
MKFEKIRETHFINLDDFDRSQEVKRVYINDSGSLRLKDQIWTMDWSLKHKRKVATNLKSDDCIAYAVWENEKVIGFVSVMKALIGCRMVLDIIQVDRAFRGQGIGRQLFTLAVAEAKRAGAKELYISACCSEETVNFYKAMGAVPTDDPIPEIAEAEPYDIQMVCPILRTNTMNVKINTLYPELFLELYRSVGWEAPDLDQITMALEHSFATFCAYDGEQPVGMARLLGDGGMSFYIKDFAVRPEYQGKGVGSLLMTAIEEYIMSHIPNGWAVSLELISSKGREPFYERFGFDQRPCDWDGAGMFKMIRK